MKYQCPHCHKNDLIGEFSECVVEFTGKFDQFGSIETTSHEIIDDVDGSEPYYYCYSCRQRFNNPEEIEDSND